MQKKLTKSRSNVIISGSLAGIAEYIGVDVTIVRVLYVLLSFGTAIFPGFLLYIVMMLVMPPGKRNWDHSYNPYDSSYTYKKKDRPRKEVEKLDPDDDDWSDF